MLDKKVSEKVVWENSVVPDNEVAPIVPQEQAEPQKMFCYKCNNVIPSNSKYCPYCQVELHTECPKCGVKYSSQYPSCSQCGTNRREYLEFLRKEQERKKALEAERRRQAEMAERKRLEEECKRKEKEEELERQKSLEIYRRQEAYKKQQEAYFKEKAEIMDTKGFKITYSLLLEALKYYRLKTIISFFLWIFCIGVLLLFFVADPDFKEMANSSSSSLNETFLVLFVLLFLPFAFSSVIVKYFYYDFTPKKRYKVVSRYLSKKEGYDMYVVDYVMKSQGIDLWDSFFVKKEKIELLCIEAYRKNKIKK